MEKRYCPDEKRHFSREVTWTLKGAAVLLMLIHHLFYCFPDFVETYQVSTFLLPLNKVMVLSLHGKICVAVFVFLSAYGMTASSGEGGRGEWVSRAGKRFRKLEGGFLFVYLCSILTCFLRPDGLGVYMKEGRLKGVFYMALDAVGLADLFGSPTYNETWWYMSVAILLIFLFPMLLELYRRYGICVLAAAGMFPYLFATTVFTSYLFAVFLGIFLADSPCLAGIAGLSPPKRKLALLGAVLLLGIFCLVRWKWGYTYWVDGLAAAAASTALFIVIDLFHVGVLKPLAFLGRHSMNIFLVHTLIFEYYFTDFIYAPKNWLLITALLTGVSLTVSVVLERGKQIIGKKIGGLGLQ